ncbi:MAG: endonuclease/exonuclease/phosphatase family protein [Desulfobacteraceae bacterium]|nr:endonuclease/exonuclease/phosphatase family protein [Desulfobacteraceae bacterium]
MKFLMKVAERRCSILALMLLVATLTFSVTMSPALADSDKRVVKVMTQNMDAGTDLLFFFVTDPISATKLTYEELQAANFRGRAELLADQIVNQQPYLISLQEVTLWQTISVTGEVGVMADQLDLIIHALAARHQQYKVVASQNLTDITAPLGDGSALRFLDRNVILARTDLKQSELALSNVQSGIYQATIAPVPGFPEELNGWLSVDAKIRGKSLRFFATHLESPVSQNDPTQVLQGQELITIMQQSKLPVILAGDFNSDASGLGLGPDQTPTAAMIVEAGYVDAWQMLHPRDPGLTWPYYLEDIYAGPSYPFERIDLIFARDLEILTVAVVGNNPPFPSDHSGVVATLQIEK